MRIQRGLFRGMVYGHMLVLASSLCVVAPLAGQGNGAPAPPARPRLEEDADTNDATAYYRFGVARLRLKPEEAAAAFYWSARLEPSSPEAFYGRRVALLLADPWRLEHYIDGDRSVLRSPEIRSIDSLQRHAVMLDPFFFRGHDDVLVEGYLHQVMTRSAREEGETISEAAFRFWAERYMHDAPPENRAWLAYSERRFREAADGWAISLRRNPKDGHLRAERARALFLLGAFDSARVEMAAAITNARQEDTSKIQFVYESKAQWEYSLGMIHEQLGDPRAAKEAYQRSVMEDLAFYPAHRRLAIIALSAGDTSAALVELGRALEVKDDDYVGQLTLGYLLDAARRYDSAAAHLRRAAELEPYAATAQYLLGRTLDALSDKPGAIGAYERCARLSKRGDTFGGTAAARAAVLRSGSGGARGPE